MKKSKNIESLRDRIQKLLFLANLIRYAGKGSDEAFYFLEDEIDLLQEAYLEASDELEALI